MATILDHSMNLVVTLEIVENVYWQIRKLTFDGNICPVNNFWVNYFVFGKPFFYETLCFLGETFFYFL